MLFHLVPGLPAIEADAAQIQQLVMNLVINGAEAIGEGKPGTVAIRTGLRELSVQDVFTPEWSRQGCCRGDVLAEPQTR